jgi:hypothetical protein
MRFNDSPQQSSSSTINRVIDALETLENAQSQPFEAEWKGKNEKKMNSI